MTFKLQRFHHTQGSLTNAIPNGTARLGGIKYSDITPIRWSMLLNKRACLRHDSAVQHYLGVTLANARSHHLWFVQSMGCSRIQGGSLRSPNDLGQIIVPMVSKQIRGPTRTVLLVITKVGSFSPCIARETTSVPGLQARSTKTPLGFF